MIINFKYRYTSNLFHCKLQPYDLEVNHTKTVPGLRQKSALQLLTGTFFAEVNAVVVPLIKLLPSLYPDSSYMSIVSLKLTCFLPKTCSTL